MTSVAIASKNLSKTFKEGLGSSKVDALKNLTFEIPESKVTGFLGPNGSGKSTFIKVATGFVKPSSGNVSFFNGREFSEIKSRVGFVPEKPNHPLRFKGREILKLHAQIMQVDLSKVREVAHLVALDKALDRSFATYSKGMKQRLAIAQALLADPCLLLLDEPLSGLDPDGRELLIQVIINFAEQPGKTVVLSSHLLEDLQRICDNLVVIDKGKLLFSGDPTSVFDPECFYIRFRQEQKNSLLKVVREDLNKELTKLIEREGVEILSVEPETKAISALYFDLTKGKK